MPRNGYVLAIVCERFPFIILIFECFSIVGKVCSLFLEVVQ